MRHHEVHHVVRDGASVGAGGLKPPYPRNSIGGKGEGEGEERKKEQEE